LPYAKAWFECEAGRVREPLRSVLKRGALVASRGACPKATHQMRGAPEVDIHVCGRIAQGADDRRGLRTRCGRRSSSRARPTLSSPGSAIPGRRSKSPRVKSTVAYTPSPTAGSPFSIFARVGRVIRARSATTAMGRRRRRRASRISAPIFRSARLTGIGRGGVLGISLSVSVRLH
jgi:hypothetical protein